MLSYLCLSKFADHYPALVHNSPMIDEQTTTAIGYQLLAVWLQPAGCLSSAANSANSAVFFAFWLLAMGYQLPCSLINSASPANSPTRDVRAEHANSPTPFRCSSFPIPHSMVPVFTPPPHASGTHPPYPQTPPPPPVL